MKTSLYFFLALAFSISAFGQNQYYGSFHGNGSGLTNVNSAILNGLPASSYVLLQGNPENGYALNAQYFGATGTGTNDDSVGINAAILVASNLNLAVYMPPGIYAISNSVIVSVPLWGAGNQLTICRNYMFITNAVDPLPFRMENGAQLADFQITNMFIYPAKTNVYQACFGMETNDTASIFYTYRMLCYGDADGAYFSTATNHEWIDVGSTFNTRWDTIAETAAAGETCNFTDILYQTTLVVSNTSGMAFFTPVNRRAFNLNTTGTGSLSVYGGSMSVITNGVGKESLCYYICNVASTGAGGNVVVHSCKFFGLATNTFGNGFDDFGSSYNWTFDAGIPWNGYFQPNPQLANDAASQTYISQVWFPSPTLIGSIGGGIPAIVNLSPGTFVTNNAATAASNSVAFSSYTYVGNFVGNNYSTTNQSFLFSGNTNNYVEINVQNQNNGTNASSDLVATAPNGNASQGYVDLGINSQTFVGGQGYIGSSNDSYLYFQNIPTNTYGKNLYIGNAATNGTFIFFGTSPLINTPYNFTNEAVFSPSNAVFNVALIIPGGGTLGTVVNTNWILGGKYSFPYPILVNAEAVLGITAVAGAANMTLEIAGNTTNSVAVQSIVTSLTSASTNQITGFIPANTTFDFTNKSTGVGDGATLYGGQYIIQ
jgi:hypothetical protein